MSWYKITLTDEQFLNGQEFELVNKFGRLCTYQGHIYNLKDVALFKNTIHSVNEYYISPPSIELPGVQELIKDYFGEECIKPSLSDLLFLSGGDSHNCDF